MKCVYQKNIKDCGVACLLTILKHYGGNEKYEEVRRLTRCDNNGVSALNLITAANKLGFNARGLKCNLDDLNSLTFPLIAHTIINDYNHFIVVKKICNGNVYVFDPIKGNMVYTNNEFIDIWDNIVIELVKNNELCNNKDSYKSLLSIMFNNYKLYISIFIVTFVSLFLSLISNYYFKSLIDYSNYILCLILFSIIVFIKETSDLIKNKLIIKLDSNIETSLNINTHNNMFLLPNYYFNSRSVGDINTKFNDLDYIKELFVNVPIFITIDLLLIVISTIILISISSKLFFMFIIICLMYLFVIVLFDKSIKKSIILNQELNSTKNSVVFENIKGINTIKNLKIEDYRFNIFKNIFNIYRDNRTILDSTYNYLNYFKNIVLFIGINVLLYSGMLMVNNNIIKLSDLILFNSILIYYVDPLNNLCDLSKIIKNGVNALKRVNEIYSGDKHILNSATDYNISINNLCYSFDNLNNIINNFNYKINNKDKIIVKGESGTGKSTLFKILNKTYEIDNNMIYIGNNDINSVDIDIMYVSQEEILFNDTIYNNIVLNNDNNHLNDVLDLTLVNDILKNKNININSVLDEDGNNLSKGEKQKIILARSLLKNSNVYIFDEVLSNVSKTDEYNIMNNILKYYNDKTIIYITHTDNCDDLFNKKLILKEAL